MKAYLDEHLQGTTTKGHEPEVTVVRKSGTRHVELKGVRQPRVRLWRSQWCT